MGNKTYQSPAPSRGAETDGNDIEQTLESLGIFSIALDDAADEWNAMHQHKKKRIPKRKR